MRNYDQKAKDMAESVLPSTRRDSARRDRQAIHGRHRARQHSGLRQIQLGGAEHEFDPSLERRRRQETSEFVGDRRAADKVGPLVRWARARVSRDPALGRLSLDGQVVELARLMPDNLIGRHAAQHIRWGLEADIRREQRRARSLRTGDGDALAEMAAEVRRILEFGRHRELNDVIRALVRAEMDASAPPTHRWHLPATPTRLRLLVGLHDVKDFAAVHHRRGPVRAAVARLAK